MQQAKINVKRVLSVMLAILILAAALPFTTSMTADAVISTDLSNVQVTRDSETQVTLTATSKAVGSCFYLSSTNATETASTVKGGTSFMYMIGSVSQTIAISSSDTYLHLIRNLDSQDSDVLSIPIDPFSAPVDYTLYYRANGGANWGLYQGESGADEYPGKGTTWDWEYDYGTSKITLILKDGFNFTTTAPTAMSVKGGNFSISVEGAATIKSTSTAGETYGINMGDFTGKMQVELADNASLAIEGGSVNNANAYGIYSTKSATIGFSGNGTANISTGAAFRTYGVYTSNGSLSVTDGATVNASSVNASNDGIGVYVKNLSVTDGAKLTAKSEPNYALKISSKITEGLEIKGTTDGATTDLQGTALSDSGIVQVGTTNAKYAEVVEGDTTLYFGKSTGGKWSLWKDETFTREYKEQTDKWTASENKLVLNGFSYTTSTPIALSYRNAAALEVEVHGDNLIETTSTADTDTYAFKFNGVDFNTNSLTISGEGKLSLKTGRPATTTNSHSTLNLYYGDLIVKGATLEVTNGGSSAGSQCSAIYMQYGNIWIKDYAVVNATTGESTNDTSVTGIQMMALNRNLNVEPGCYVTAIGYKNAIYSNGTTPAQSDFTGNVKGSVNIDGSSPGDVNWKLVPAQAGRYALKSNNTDVKWIGIAPPDFTMVYNADDGKFHKDSKTGAEVTLDSTIAVSGTQATPTITLDGFHFSSTAKSANSVFVVPGGSTIVLAEGSENSIINVSENVSVKGLITGSAGDLTIEGKGKLDISVIKPVEEDEVSTRGMDAGNGKVTVDGAHLTVDTSKASRRGTDGSENPSNFAITATSLELVNEALVEAYAGESIKVGTPNNRSAGVCTSAALKGISIEEGSVLKASGHYTAVLLNLNDTDIPAVDDSTPIKASESNDGSSPASSTTAKTISGEGKVYTVGADDSKIAKWVQVGEPLAVPDYTLYFGKSISGKWSLWETWDDDDGLLNEYTGNSGKWTASEGKLSLNGFNFESTANESLYLTTDTTIELTGKNSIKNDSLTNSSRAIDCREGLTIEGSGSFTVEGKDYAETGSNLSTGINFINSQKDLIIKEATVTVKGGYANSSKGINAGTSKTTGSSVKLRDGAKVTAISDPVNSTGYGVGCKTLDIEDGCTLIAKGGWPISTYNGAEILTEHKVQADADYDGAGKTTENVTYSEPRFKVGGEWAKYVEISTATMDYTLVYSPSTKKFHKNTTSGEELPTPAGITVSESGSTLTLNGFNFKTTATPAMQIEGDVQIMLTDGSVNSIETTANGGDIVGFKSVGALTVRGIYPVTSPGTFNVIASKAAGDADSKIAIEATGQVNFNYSVIVNAETGDITTGNYRTTTGIKATEVKIGESFIADASMVTAKAGDPNIGSSFGIRATKLSFAEPATTQACLTAIGYSMAVFVESADITRLQPVSGTGAVSYSMSTSFDGSDAFDTGAIIASNNNTHYYADSKSVMVQWVKLGAIGPSISIGTQSGTLTHGDAVNDTATYAVTVSGFDTAPTAYTTKWYSDAAGTQSITAPTGIALSAGTVTDGACTYTAEYNGTADAGTYYFTLTSGTGENAITSKPAKLTVAKATMTDTDYTAKSVTVKANTQGAGTAELPEIPAGASYGTVTRISDSWSLFAGLPTVSGTILSYYATSKVEGITATYKVAVSAGTNYNAYDLTVTFTTKDKESVEITGVNSTVVKYYDGLEMKGYTGTPSSGKYTGKLEVKYSGRSGTVYSSTTAPKNAGFYTVTISVPDTDETYTGSVALDFQIDKANVTAQPKSVTVNVGAPMPTFELEYVGIVSGDTITPSIPASISAWTALDGVQVTDTSSTGSYLLYWANEGSVNFDSYKNYTITKQRSVAGGFTVKKPSTPTPEPEITVTPDANEDDEFDIKVPDSLKGEQNKVTIPETEKQGSGTVPIIIEPADRAGEFVPKSMLDDGTVVFLVDETMKVKIVDNAKDFNDVKSSDWFSDNIDFVSARELFNGTSETTFSPSSPLTRGMFATVLWRLELTPNATGSQFGDINSGAYYADAAVWGASTGVIEGIGNNQFAPSRNITRQDLVLMMYRYAKYLGMDVSNNEDLSGYEDGDKVSGYAIEAMKWAVDSGIITGSDGEINPKGNATRAQASAILQRFVEYLLAR